MAVGEAGNYQMCFKLQQHQAQLFEDLPALLLGAANAADATEATAKVEEKRILAA